MSLTLNAKVALEEIDCDGCGGVYALSERFIQSRRKEGGSWVCPYCQGSISFSESENTKLKRQLEDVKKSKQWYADRLRNEQAAHKHTANQLRTTKGALTKVKKRTAHGVCPCCNRTFKQLAAHMKRKHPGYIADADSKATA